MHPEGLVYQGVGVAGGRYTRYLPLLTSSGGHRSGRYASYWNAFLLPLCFYTCLSSCSQGGSASVHAGIPLPQADPPRDQAPHWSREPTPPRPDTPWDQAPPPGPGTPPQDQAPPPRSRHPPPSRDGYCCGRYASYWNAFLFKHMNTLPMMGKPFAVGGRTSIRTSNRNM